MKYKLFFFQFLYLSILCSCINNKQEKSIVILKHHLIDIGENVIGYGGFLAQNQGSIVGLDFAPTVQPFFCIKPYGESQTLFRFGNKGQGPDDFLWPASIQFINNQTIGAFDMMSGTYNIFSIPSEHEELNIDKKIKFQIQLSKVIKTAFNQYIGLSVKEEMFLLADSSGMTINTFFEYPYKDIDERQFVSRSHAYQGVLVTNPLKDKFVYSSFHGEIIHFYRIENNNIETISKIEKEYPIYRKRNDNYDGVEFNINTKAGYIATYATNKFVYAIFSGVKISEIKSVNFEGEILRIFDWNGVLVKEYILDIPCSYLCVSDDDSKIWAIASNPDIALVSFDFENKQNNDIQTQKKPDLNESQLINGNSVQQHTFEITNEGMQDEEKQKILDSIKNQLMNGNNKRIDINADIIKDTIADNTIKIQLKLK